MNHNEAADIETASDGYARRFAGAIGEWMLGCQSGIVLDLLSDHANVDGVTLTLILFEYDPRLADAGANKLDEVNIADVSHKKGEATVIEFTVGKGKKTRADRGYYLSARGYRDGDYVYYGTPGQGGIGRVLTEGHPHVVKYTGKRMKP